jgi:hypothetical protein
MRLGLEAVEDMAVEVAAVAVAVEHRTPWAVAATLAAAAISAELASAAARVSVGFPTSVAERALAAPDLRCPGLRQGRVSTPNAHLLFGAPRTGLSAAARRWSQIEAPHEAWHSAGTETQHLLAIRAPARGHSQCGTR